MSRTIYNPENTYPKGTPFTYLIGWTVLDTFYYGVRFRKTCHPSDLWNTYFTSSTPVEEFRLANGEPDLIKVDFVFDTKEEARVYEDYFFRENNCVRDTKWLNLCRGGEDFCNLGHSEETRQRMSDAKKGRPSNRKGKPNSEEQKQKQSDAMKGNSNRLGIPHTDEAKQKMSDAAKGKPKSAEHIKNKADAQRGKTKGPRSAESILKYKETCRLKRLAKLENISDLF